MNNSLVDYLKRYATALMKDLRFAYTHQSEWRRDQTRLLHELDVNGSRVLTIDFPAIGKVLDKSLDEGLIQQEAMSQLRYGSLSRGTPKFFGDLWAQVFATDGKLRDTPSVDAITALRQLHLSAKKIKLNCNRKGVVNEVRNFYDIEQSIRSPSLRWDDDFVDFGNSMLSFTDIMPPRGPSGYWPGSFFEDHESNLFSERRFAEDREKWYRLDALQHVCDRISIQFGDLHIEKDSELPKHGPGVVSNHGRSVSKYRFTEWPTKLQTVFPFDRYGVTSLSDSVSIDGLMDGISLKETPSKLIAVPKTMTKPRLIAAEPNQHQWIQQLVRNQLETRLQKTQLKRCIDFRSQDRNRSMALSGSVDGGYATIDLSSASDRLSCFAIERAFRRNPSILERVHAGRTRWLSDALSFRQPEYIRLKKFAAQGSSVTFPVQTIFYACVAISAVILTKRWQINSNNIGKAANQVSVFGDDIIVPKDSMGVVVQLLEACGLQVNSSKSFGNGKFRESCGMDAYAGHDVTPAYLLSADTTVSLNGSASLLEVVNNFWKKGLWHTSECIRECMNFSDNLVPIIHPSSGILGLVSFCGYDFSHLKLRWNSQLHRRERRVALVHTKRRLLETDGRHKLFQWFIEKPRPDLPWEAGTRALPVVSVRPGWIAEYDMFETREGNERSATARVALL